MITALDTNVLLDVLGADTTFGPRSRVALDRCLDEGALVVCAVVWAETAAAFPDTAAADAAFATLGAAFSATTSAAARSAGTAWRAYRAAGGPRTRVVADFLVGAHASVQADRLLTRDRGFHRAYFGELTILDPTG
ncbi:MAG: type II toxin-antitoxin system VapC family toxin [Pseudonocardia sp.]|nr:type II toxin-antitoxin system VapC family toxin [Pseudonocardia sp.]